MPRPAGAFAVDAPLVSARRDEQRGATLGGCVVYDRAGSAVGDPRVGDRQQVCSPPSCQPARRKKMQASSRERNPDSFVARRLKQRTAMAPPPPALLRVPPPLDRLPWDIAQDQFGVQGADFLGVLSRVLLGAAQDQRQAQVLDTS